ncbi:YD repeat-containing protein [Candidatus Thiomargarita nelsonii]|uniref:YD repeat-containing protein n=1 Tax=Candidatus Thiomargarita nelsonii TaxID=1003181 RepID=A0A176RV58_9GAMM|nr:YD repeat-containing protein [Candidatus Thiomargarita nelsonii]
MGMSEKFDYDSTSNIIQLDDIVLEYGPGDTLQRQGDTQYLYDANGRLIKKIEDCDSAEPKVWLFEWDAEDQLRSVTTPAGEVWEYKYDALGRRIVKEGPEKKVRFVWDGDVVVHEVENEVVNSGWIFEPESFIPLAKVENEQLYSVVCDHLGTPREMVDSEGGIIWSVSYKAWGKVDQVKLQVIDCPIRFQGQYFDAETGFHYNLFRYYDPNAGKFINQDPIGLLGGDNLYQYVSNPVAWIDPWGLTYEVSPSRRTHILEGDPPGTGHGPNRGQTMGAFPDTWNDNQAIAAIERTANSPNSTWRQSTGPGVGTITTGGPAPNAPTHNSKGNPVRFEVSGRAYSKTIVAIVEPVGEKIITGYCKS